MAKVITKENLKGLAFSLSEKQRVIAPIKKSSHSVLSKYAFEEIRPSNNISFDFAVTALPPKEFLLPPRDVLFQFEGTKLQKSAKTEETIFFGLNTADMEGVSLLARIFSKPIGDDVFENRYERFTFIVIDRFSPPKNTPFDLYLMKINEDTFAAFAGSKKGRAITRSKYFYSQKVNIPIVKKKTDDILSEKDLPKIIEKSKNHKIWRELSEICFGCGICSYVCPLCYCFEVEDEIDITAKNGSKGQRCRTWDSCMLMHFAETSNHNFRPELSDRIYNWYYHKFVRMPREIGHIGCVDCNRCVIYCPAKINYQKVLAELISDYHKKVKKPRRIVGISDGVRYSSQSSDPTSPSIDKKKATGTKK